MSIKRGDIYLYDFGKNAGSVQSGSRPVFVVQANQFNDRAPTVTVAAITTAIKKQRLPSHILLPDGTGLNERSMVLLEQIRSVNKEELQKYIGCLKDPDTWRKINNGIRKTFGLWQYREERSGDIRCLCPKCMGDYKNNPNFIVKRVDPFSSKLGQCEKCNGMGYDYIVLSKKNLH